MNFSFMIAANSNSEVAGFVSSGKNYTFYSNLSQFSLPNIDPFPSFVKISFFLFIFNCLFIGLCFC